MRYSLSPPGMLKQLDKDRRTRYLPGTMFLILTGGIACGKSSVLAALQQLPGCHVFSADEAVHAAYQSAEVCDRTRLALGLGGSGVLSREERAGIRALVLKDSAAKSALEAILHPLAFEGMQKAQAEARARGAQVFVAEVPLYYETGRRLDPDLVIVVAASRVSQLSRLCVDRGLDRETAEALLSIQLPVKDKADRADIVLWNDGSRLQLQRQTDLLTRSLHSRIHDRNPSSPTV
jgi:dephospho-CoA kinase